MHILKLMESAPTDGIREAAERAAYGIVKWMKAQKSIPSKVKLRELPRGTLGSLYNHLRTMSICFGSDPTVRIKQIYNPFSKEVVINLPAQPIADFTVADWKKVQYSLTRALNLRMEHVTSARAAKAEEAAVKDQIDNELNVQK